MSEVDASDRATLAAVFAARVNLAKISEEQAIEDARDEWRRTQTWVKSPSKKPGSFLWFCDTFEHDAGAVRRAIAAKVH